MTINQENIHAILSTHHQFNTLGTQLLMSSLFFFLKKNELKKVNKHF